MDSCVHQMPARARSTGKRRKTHLAAATQGELESKKKATRVCCSRGIQAMGTAAASARSCHASGSVSISESSIRFLLSLRAQRWCDLHAFQDSRGSTLLVI